MGKLDYNGFSIRIAYVLFVSLRIKRLKYTSDKVKSVLLTNYEKMSAAEKQNVSSAANIYCFFIYL